MEVVEGIDKKNGGCFGEEDALWNEIAMQLLHNGGIALLPLSPQIQETVHSAFASSRKTLDGIHDESAVVRKIPEDADSAHATGYHAAGSHNSLSRYNACREGFVFSNGETLACDDNNDFESTTKALQITLHQMANHVMQAIAVQLQLPPSWMQDTLGYCSGEDYSQWHIKRYIMPDASNQTDKDPQVLLPSHTDPSLISIVILDRQGVHPGAMGLQYYKQQNGKGREWIQVPQHGHGVAIVIVGSILSYITGGYISAPKHRVVPTSSKIDRLAATFFLRPKPDALLQIPPSPLLHDKTLKKQLTFATWQARVSRNYMKKKTTQSSLPKSKEPSSSTPKTTEWRLPYYQDEFTEMTLLATNPPLSGREKFLGGELAPSNGKIYTIPGHASQVLVLEEQSGNVMIRAIGPKYAGEYKWLRAVRIETSGIIIGIPCHADSLLRIDPKNDHVSTISWNQTDPKAPPKGLPWKWHGGAIAPHDGCLYCIPQFAETILKFDPQTEHVSFWGGPFPGRNKWYGGLIGPKDGAIYGICQNATGVLRIDPKTQTATIHGDFPSGGYKWHGGVLGPDGNIYGIPAHANTVLKIEPNHPNPKISTFGGPLRSGQHRTDDKYKYLGGTVGHDDKIYFFPSDADYVLQVDPNTCSAKEVGPNLRDLEPNFHNKWQNGFTAPDGCIYGIPLKATSVVRIQTYKGGTTDPEITTVGGPFPGLNKWEGGVMSADGTMYCMPLNCNSFLQIKPRSKAKPNNGMVQTSFYE